MKIPKDKKKQILADKNILSLNELSKKYNIPRSEVKNIIRSADKKFPKWFYGILVLIPFVLLILLEISLRIFNYGYNTHQWVDAGDGKLVINPEIGKRYFNNINFVPKTIEDVFDQVKKENTFRVFVLGGSSAEGYPYTPLGSFSRYIRKRLELVYPDTHIEVVNVSMTAVNSYTILDLIPGVLEQKPDLILIYAGHNEFYGALGVGSMETVGSSRVLAKLLLYLDDFKITQLVRNSIHWISSLFSSADEEKSSGTLMSRMAKNKYILLNSDKFKSGLEQFSENLSQILTLIKDKGVPVILGRLVSNLKDQKPFISINTPGYGTAEQIYKEAQAELNNNNNAAADSLFKLAKDLDALRFRAPEKMNDIIDKLGKEFNAGIAPIDSLFDSKSPDKIVGSNLIVDHLHPNIKGYQLMGEAFYDVMEKSGDLPKYEKPKIPFEVQDSITRADFIFSKLDSAIGNDIVYTLKNSWPFVENSKNSFTKDTFIRGDFIDSIAAEFMDNEITWADAHLKAATKYLRNDDIKDYLKHMNIIIYQYPGLKDLRTAIKYFYEKKMLNPADYTVKRIGLIALYNKNYNDAINNLTESYKSNPQDAQVLFGLAESYFGVKDFINAKSFIIKCMNVKPEYPQANNLKVQIIESEKKQLKK